MKILHVISAMDPRGGGVAEAVRSLISGSKQIGEEATHAIVSCDPPDAGWLGNDGFSIHAVGPGRYGYAYSSRLGPWLDDHLGRYDAVVVHGLWQFHGWATLRAVRKLGRRGRAPKFFVMPHGMLDPYFQRAKERKWKAIRNVVYWKLIEQHVINDADAVLFTCQQELLLAKEPFGGYRPRSEHVVGLGIADPPPPTPRIYEAFAERCPEVLGRRYWLYLSRVHPKKGVDLLVRAYGEVAAEHGDAVPDLVIAGPCHDPEYLGWLKSLSAEAIRGAGRIVFCDMLTGDAKWGALHGCEALVLPSHQENFGIAVVEALACNKPVLISNQVNIWKEIVERGAGIAEDDTADGTRRLLERHLAAGVPRCPDAPRACYEQHFSIQGAAAEFARVMKGDC